MEDDAADELDVEVTLTQGAAGSFPNNGKSFRQKSVNIFPFGKTLLKFSRFCFELVIAQFLQNEFLAIDLLDERLQAVYFPLVFAAKNFFQKGIERKHKSFFKKNPDKEFLIEAVFSNPFEI